MFFQFTLSKQYLIHCLFFRWFSGEPNNTFGNDLINLAEGCVIFSKSIGFKLNDASCSLARQFVCEYTNKTWFNCSGNLYFDSILGCGWFFITVI